MYKVSLLVLALAIGGCAQHSMTPASTQQTKAKIPPASGQAQKTSGLTLNQIMADPEWIGMKPYLSHWRYDSKAVYFDQYSSSEPYPKRVELQLDGQHRALIIGERYQTDQEDGVNNADNSLRAYIYRGNLFLSDRKSGKVRQLTQSSEHVTQVRFLTDGRVAYRQGDQFFALDLATGLARQLLDIRLTRSPKPPGEPQVFLAQEQQALIGWIAKNQQKAKAKYQADKTWQQQDLASTPAPIYLGNDHELKDVRLSASGRYALIAYSEKRKERSKTDIMPNYITFDGTVESRNVRQRVADANPAPLKLMLADLANQDQRILALSHLPGMDEDVFTKVIDANQKAYGDAYQVPEKKDRKLQLMEDWGASESSLRWHPNKDIVAFMVEAVDNKDRWIASVNLESSFFNAPLLTQHRLHDDAWVNYDFNSFGWAGEALYYLSEETGYSNLYLKPLTGVAKALVQGPQEVQNLTLSADEQHIYYVSNPVHPGIYDVFRMDLISGSIQQLTQLKGMTDYQLSPDGQKLLLTHSKINQPNELWLAHADGSNSPTQLTHTVRDEFKAVDWQIPQIVAMNSPYDEQPVYSKVFYPKGYDASQSNAYPAVMFVHGAGYLQNVHQGWSGYFREYMFHNLLAENGYVVMDIDYRASQGYGRDFRTAIYRNMGHPEVEDMKLGVQWLAENAQVDANRVGVYGGSYGGFLTFMALFTEPELFQAGAALRPVSDWAHYNAPYTSNILNTPQIDPQAYRISSPIYHADGLTKPLLINAPMLDDNVFFQDVVRLVQRLIELEKDNFETALFPVEPHSFKEPSSWLDEYKRIFKLFEENLK